ncbi:PhyR family response regulator anti-anti-sigma factor [Kozakia baliensis]|uniref:Regulator n=1 Tax=Kozakia baliensis TaxID=153496 RepID=A0A1D8UTJ6_9PROT|nr:response regulator [Kozakia baliensis]AOX16973.1 regulator [Kozakia baliensis]AOX19785.1 regulator [Kozakia baliensis]GBR25398.1 two-component response regulator [Kozakia baliensis NRIC 0488]GEL63975.1 two-component response regulator [Kozakia baliensis]
MVDVRRQELIQALPFARRFARALAGGQAQGDMLVANSLKQLATHKEDTLPARLSLYRHIAQNFVKEHPASELDAGLTINQRLLLLLTALEELSVATAAQILEIDENAALAEISRANEGLRLVAETSVLIIEDEPIIAMDIQDVVEQCGHRIAGVAHTEADAVRLAEETKPGLILADINLGGGGDGMQAVGRIMKRHQAPVIFVTAYPERLLTGETEEPSFVITKPFEPMTLAITTYQAVTGGLKAL